MALAAPLISGVFSVAVTVVNHVLGKQQAVAKEADAFMAQRQVELQHDLLQAKKRCIALEMELANVALQLTKKEEAAKQRRLKAAVEQLQLQIRWQRLERINNLPFAGLWRRVTVQNLVGAFAIAVFLFVLAACTAANLHLFFAVLLE
ncbi:hypothetical protein ACHHYP_20843 [Achlya hypogyna]|uniref:Uncharacterized protein n=1 Tax=Achlya hypogyna TaxID=1202772 RepID=A0A1V9ZDU1_ACHHY|nr:hypothetical protein ACHHYP_20843 [Achlya hypogyna]